MVKILVIEDEMEIRANLLELLALEGHDVIGADNGVTGLVGAMEFQPDLILCDVMMPELDGYDVLSALRQEPETALIPFIFLTAFADKGDIRQGMALGADDYLTKPFTCSEVLEAIETRLKRQMLVAENFEARQAQIAAQQEKAQQFRDELDREKIELLADMRQNLKGTITTLNAVNSILQTLPAGMERDQSMEILHNVCTAKIRLLTKIPNFEYLELDEVA